MLTWGLMGVWMSISRGGDMARWWARGCQRHVIDEVEAWHGHGRVDVNVMLLTWRHGALTGAWMRWMHGALTGAWMSCG